MTNQYQISSLLEELGPMRSGLIAEKLQKELGLSSEAARKRISRIKPPIRRFPIQLLPKGEGFLYLEEQRQAECFWTKYHTALRDTGSVYAHAIDALVARGGVVSSEEFAVISGAPFAMKGQISVNRLLDTMIKAGIVKRGRLRNLSDCVKIARYELGWPDLDGYRVRRLTEGIILDAVREWMRKLGIASYNKIVIRGDESERMVGQFKWDLTAPSYLHPLKRDEGKPGFVAADVFASSDLREFEIRYFIRKVNLLRSSVPVRVLPILIADNFSRAALQAGKSAGVMMATPSNLFGNRIGLALLTLFKTLENAAAIAASNPAKLAKLVEDLVEIEGTAGNLRGVLFELIVAYLARIDAVSVDIAIAARDPGTGKLAEIDVLKIQSKTACVCIECKGKGPGGEVALEEIEDWFDRIPTFRAHLRNQERFREVQLSFEMWTTGTFTSDALAKLQYEQAHRTKFSIDWKDGLAVSEVAKGGKEKAIRIALDNHFLKHPLS